MRQGTVKFSINNIQARQDARLIYHLRIPLVTAETFCPAV